MTLTLFMSLLAILAVAVSTITEMIKTVLNDTEINYSSNLVVLIVSVIVGIGGTAVTYILLGIAYTLPNVVCMVLMALAVWLVAMGGYDKVLQMLEQLRGLKK